MTDISSSRRMPFRPSWRGITLKRWRLHNFKSVRDAEVELRPLTVVVGANSAGKSTLLQSIRAASQAIAANGALYPLNGRGVGLGTVSDVTYRGSLSIDERDEIAVQVDEQAPGQDDERRKELARTLHEQFLGERQLVLGADFEFRSPMVVDRPARSNRPVSSPMATLSWDVKLGPSTQQLGVARIERLDVRLNPNGEDSQREDRVDPAWLLAFSSGDSGDMPDVEEDGVLPALRDFTGQFSGRAPGVLDIVDIRVAGGFPLQASVLRPRAEVLFDSWLSLVLRPTPRYREDVQGFPSPVDRPADALAAYLAETDREVRGDDADYARAVRTYLSPRSVGRVGIDLNTAVEQNFRTEVIGLLDTLGVAGDVPSPTDLDDLGPASSASSEFLRSYIRYLGPLREEPRAAYADSPEGDDSYVGAKGEFTASVLLRHGRSKVRVPAPRVTRSGEFVLRDGAPEFETNPKGLQLDTAVNRWAEYLDIGQSFSVRDSGRFGIQMQVRQKDVDGDLDLTSVGTGVSQLLPVLVMCLQAPVGSLLLIEQPELHLNPRVQQRLADFLLQIAQSGRHLLVETHSEYLISRLRRRMAEDPKDSVNDQVGIYFANRIDGATTYSLVKTNEFGGVDDWPENFFDQATDEEHAILSAAVRKRRNRAGHGV